MKLLKQPWFLIAIFLLGIYSYNMSKIENLTFGTNVAYAGDEAEATSSEDGMKESMKVDQTLEFKTSKVKRFEVATYQNLNIKMRPYDGDKIQVRLEGKGRRYKAKGEAFKDWLDVVNSKGRLTVKSYSKDGINVKFRDIFKVSKDESLQLTVSFPKSFKFKKINLESVSSDLDADGVQFGEISMESVSGDAQFVNGKGQKISVSTVSGDIDAKDIEVRSGAFKSVSGDATIKALVEKPDFSFESVSGDLKLSLPSTAKIDVNFESMTGTLDNEFGKGSDDSGSLSISSLSGDAEVIKIK